MKKRLFCAAAALLALLLSACSVAPSRTADGQSWSEDWVTLGPVLGVEPQEHGLTLLDNNTALTASDMYYAVWTIGEPTPYTNADGDEVDLYPARLDVLVYGCADGEHARAAVEEWTGRQDELYAVAGREDAAYNGQDYLITTYACGSDTNPYSRGVSAFGVCGKYAVSMEFNCLDSFDGDVAEILADFLSGCHYGDGVPDQS